MRILHQAVQSAALGWVITCCATTNSQAQPSISWNGHIDSNSAGFEHHGVLFEKGHIHWYERVDVQGEETSWSTARAAAEGMSFRGVAGHLATITSAEENAIIASILPGGPTDRYWIGGMQDAGGSEPGGGWRWINGEPWQYTNWAVDQPNNFGSGGRQEDFLEIWADPLPPGKWNDTDDADLGGPQGSMRGSFIVEYVTLIPEPSTAAIALLGFLALSGYGSTHRLLCF